MYTSDRRMLDLKELLKANGTIRFDKQFCESIGILPQNLTKISNKEKHFTPDHIEKACKFYSVDANWMFGLADVPFRKQRVTKAVTLTPKDE